jgi:hypothetical protein
MTSVVADAAQRTVAGRTARFRQTLIADTAVDASLTDLAELHTTGVIDFAHDRSHWAFDLGAEGMYHAIHDGRTMFMESPDGWVSSQSDTDWDADTCIGVLRDLVRAETLGASVSDDLSAPTPRFAFRLVRSAPHDPLDGDAAIDVDGRVCQLVWAMPDASGISVTLDLWDFDVPGPVELPPVS